MVAFRRARICPICGKEDLKYLVSHLRKVHNLSSAQRFEPLLRAKFQGIKVYAYEDRKRCPTQVSPDNAKKANRSTQSRVRSSKVKPVQKANLVIKVNPRTVTSNPYPNFMFKLPFSMLVVGPTSYGKTHFVRQALKTEELKHLPVEWYFNQHQREYDIYARQRGKVDMIKGFPNYDTDDLADLNPGKKKRIIVLDDLMEEVTDSKLISKLFTKKRHRNVSVILREV